MPVETPDDLLAVRSQIAELASRRAKLIATPKADAGRRGDILRLDVDLGTIIGGLLTDPLDASPDVPLVLLPVRIESKLAPGTSTLRVRISPDEVHIDSLLRSVTDAEQKAGRAYWRALWSAPADPAAAAIARSVAWQSLLDAAGPRRAAWAAEVTTPKNLAALGTGDPDFPEAPAEVAQGTVARCLPDRFVVRVFPSGGTPITVTGSPVARDVPLSPIAFGDDTLSRVSGAGLSVPLGSEWTVDFTAAKAAGLGIEVALPAGTSLIDRIVVVGARSSVSEAENATDLADLLLSHRFTDGVSLLASGTPTNNADASRSPYRPAQAVPAPSTVLLAPTTDAARLATTLGLDAEAVQHVLDPLASVSTLESAEEAANTALWFATWEPVLDKFDDADIPAVTPASIESARRLHRDDVRGAGPAPTLRIGAQPYGVLPVTDLGAWSPRGGEITAQLVPLIRRTLTRWASRSTVVPHTHPGGQVTDAGLLEILGTSSVATGVRARPAVGGPQLSTFAAATGANTTTLLAEFQLRQAVLSQYSVDAARLVLTPAVHDDSRTIGLPLVSPRDAEVVADILAGRTPQVDSVLQALLDVGWDEAQARRYRSAPQQFIGPLLQLVAVDADTRSLLQLAASADASAHDAASPALAFAAAERVQAVQHFDGQPAERARISAIEPVAEARTSLAQVALDLGDTPQARWVGSSAISDILFSFGVSIEVRAAMLALAASPIDERRIAVAHALDIASHRVDAWATGLASSRRRVLAAANPTGLTIGAFGYVEEVRLGAARRDPDGWLHAPSSSHAVAAGVLASAHRSNVGAEAGKHPFAIDLSSRRGTELRRVLQGVQAGQPIGALLGYQIERALSGSAARFQLSLREIAPMATNELENDAAGDLGKARVAAADVVDGVDLLQKFPIEGLEAGAPALRARLDTRPTNPFIETWGPVSDAEWAAVKAALRAAAATLDVVADALLSESVLQYVSGNAARASAAMDAMSTGSAVDPDLGVLGVRQSGRILTHGVFAAIPAGAEGWSKTRPRAVAEPRLEAWAARRLGDPADIVVAEVGGERLTLADAGYAALDLVFTDDVPSLERELRSALPVLGDAPLAVTRADTWPQAAHSVFAAAALAGTLRTLIAGAAPIGADALVRTGVKVQRAADTEELLNRCDALLGALSAALDSGKDVIAAIDQDTLAVAESDVAGVVAAVAPLGAFGVPLVPDTRIPANVAWAWGAWQAASARLEHARAAVEAIRAPQDPPPGPNQIIDVCKAVAEGILGDGFLLLPLLVNSGDADALPDAFVDALTKPVLTQPARSLVNAFVRDHASVMKGVARLSEAQLLGSAVGASVDLLIAQLTERDEMGKPAPGTDRWLAGPLPDDIPWPATPATHLVLELVGAAADFGGPFAGLNIDGWSETLPFQPDPGAFAEGAPAGPLRAARATTGLAVHANQASARAPQVILAAVSPDGKRWTTDSVVQTVLAALDLAKARLVTLEHSPGDAAILPAIYVASPWLQARKGLDFTELAKLKWTASAIPFLSEMKS